MADRPAPPASAARVTYGALWDLCDGDRVQAESLAASYAQEAKAPKNPDDAPFYRKRAAQFMARAEMFKTLQLLIGRIEHSPIIKDELKRMAALEKTDSDAVAAAGGDHEA